MADFYEHGNEHSGFMKYGEIFDQLKTSSFSDRLCFMALIMNYNYNDYRNIT